MKPLKGILLLAAACLLAACASDQKKSGGTASVKMVPDHEAMLRHRFLRHALPYATLPPLGQRTVDDVLYSYGPYAVDQLKPYFDEAGVAYPPRELMLIGLKEERTLEVWAKDRGPYRFIRAYDIQAASGTKGPKLRQGDRQVPEGIYHVVRLNANSNYHLSMKLDYPNDFDRYHAALEGRSRPGSDIFIHGDTVSAGCLAMGDAVIEELFVLAAHVGADNIKVVIAPHDPRKQPLDPEQPGLPSWTGDLYEQVSSEILALANTEPVKLSSIRPVQRSDRRLR